MSQQILELERKVFNLQTLYEVAKALSDCKTTDQIYKEVLTILMGTFGVEFGVVLSRNTAYNWHITTARGVEDNALAKLEKKLITQEFERIQVAERQNLLNLFFDESVEGAAANLSSAWLEFSGRNDILGGIFLGNKILGDPYSESDLELAKASCSHTAAALESLRLYEELKDAKERLQLENIALREEVTKGYEDGRLIGKSEEILKISQQAKNVAKSPTNVLLIGETGTGKEVIAKTIHYHSPRRDKPFVAVNCTAIPENLVESELFGIEAGVATGVKKHIGFFEQADTGTIFIDEIGDMPLSSQAKILRALQERSFRRVGSTREISVDVRVICATNKNLQEEMKIGNFREDLFFRLSVLELNLPPLRNRGDDIPLLLNHFIKKLQDKIDVRIKGFSTKTIKLLQGYHWPGNVRELENEVERAISLAAEGAIIQPEDLSPKFSAIADFELPTAFRTGSLREATDTLESQLIKEMLKKCHGNKSEVSRKLGVSRLGLQKKMDRLGIRTQTD